MAPGGTCLTTNDNNKLLRKRAGGNKRIQDISVFLPLATHYHAPIMVSESVLLCI